MSIRHKYTRLRGYNYAADGAYFVTINTHGRVRLFGDILDRGNDAYINLSPHGSIVQECWNAIPDHFQNVYLDTFQIMPDHAHAIVVILEGAVPPDAMMDDRPTYLAPRSIVTDHAGRGCASTLCGGRRPNGVEPRSVGAIVGSFRSAVTKRVNLSRGTPGASVWQHNYHDRIIRSAAEHERIAAYIRNDPINWIQGSRTSVW
ncbi:MAG: transposase [Flavobacteriales bacterium]